jgi:DNA-directed RNA polymerase subunit alpha
MSTPVAVDVAALFEALKFNAADLAAARAALHDSHEARSAADAASRDAGTDPKALLRRGLALYLLGRSRDAVRVLRDAGDSAPVRLARGMASLEDADPAGAAADLGAVGTSAGDLDIEIATAKGLAGDAEGARAAGARLKGRKADALYAEGLALEAEGRHEAARKAWEQAVEAEPNHARALFQLAYAHDLAGDDDKAMEVYRRCASLEPTYVNALLNLGLLYEDQDRYTEAEALYRRVLAADPTHERARLYLKDVMSAQSMVFDEDNERKEDRRNTILRTPISEFELSVRSRNCLSKMEIKTLGDLVRKSEAELLAYKNFGETSLQEIKDILAQKGLRLGMGSELPPAASMQEAEAELDALFGGAGEEDDDDELEEGQDPRTLPISAMRLTVRAQRSLEALELHTIGDVADRTEAELLANRNFGRTTLDEVVKKLASFGLQMKGGAAVPAPAGEGESADAPPSEDPADDDASSED